MTAPARAGMVSPRDPRLVVAGVAAVAFLVAATAPMTALFGPGPWVVRAVVLVAALALVTVSVRRRTGSRLRPTAVGAGALVAAAVVLAAVDDTPVPGESWVPTALRRLPQLIDQGLLQIRVGHAPLPPTAGLGLLLVLGAGLVWLALDLVVLSFGATGAAALALLGLWSPVVTYTRDLGAIPFVLGAVGLLVLIAAVPPDSARATGATARQVPGILTGAAAVGVIALVVAPMLTAVPGWSSVDPPVLFDLPGGGGRGGTERLASDLDLRTSLSDRSGQITLSYTSTTGAGGPLRLYTLTDFDGRRWTREPDPPVGSDAEGILWPVPYTPAAEDPAWSDFLLTIEALETTSVPLPLEPRTVDALGPWRYAPERDELISPSPLARGSTFLVRQVARDLTPDELRADVAVDAPGGRGHLVVPDSEHAEEIAALAREVTADATDPYSQALALQSYLRNASVFTYSLDLPEPVTDDAVFDFLTQRTGYCVQFATAFTVMARSLGLPTRVGVGYLPGRADPARPGTFVVTGSQSHAWPEVHFEGAGWVRFEPTPAGQTGPPPVYADPLLDPNATAPPEEEFPQPGTSDAPTSAPTTTPGTGGLLDPGPVSVWWLVLAVALAGVATVSLRLRRPHEVVDPDDPEVWWGRFVREAATLGVVAEPSTTPRGLGREVRDRQVAAEPGTTAGDAVDDLVRVVERNRWAPTPPEARAEQMAEWVAVALEPLRAQAARTDQRAGGGAADWR